MEINNEIKSESGSRNNELKLIPKITKYMEDAIDVISNFPRTEKFGLGNEYKVSMCEMLRAAIYIDKVETNRRLHYINVVDAELNVQRMYLRILYNRKIIREKQFHRLMNVEISEIGKMVGGLIKYYAKNNKKSV